MVIRIRLLNHISMFDGINSLFQLTRDVAFIIGQYWLFRNTR